MVKEGFIDIGKLKPGTIILIETSINAPEFNPNTEVGFAYEIVVVAGEYGECNLLGGNMCKVHEEVIFVGSITKNRTKKNQIHHNQSLKFTLFNRTIITSAVRTAKIIGDGWGLEMDWPNAEEITTQDTVE